MAETTRTRKTRVEETTTIEIDGEGLIAILAARFGLDDRAKVEVVVDDHSYNASVTLDANVTVQITQTIVSRDDTEAVVPVDPTDLAQQRGVGLGVSPLGVRRKPRRAPLPTSGDEDLGQDKG